MTFPLTQVGSWPRSEKALAALRERQLGRIDRAAFDAIADNEVRRCVAIQEDAGVDIF
ncbi:hypothetical protein BH23VER1_BH23VER1_33410 [soil metagenome]